jgi:cytochrome c553
MIRPFAVSTLTLLFSAAVAAQAPAPTAPAPAPAAPAAQSAAPAGDPAKGREKTRMCEGCHGVEGWRTAYPEVYHVPKIGGQHAAYIVQALHEYKNGDRTHPSMRAIAASLSDEDIVNLAAYFSRGGPQTTTASK